MSEKGRLPLSWARLLFYLAAASSIVALVAKEISGEPERTARAAPAFEVRELAELKDELVRLRTVLERLELERGVVAPAGVPREEPAARTPVRDDRALVEVLERIERALAVPRDTVSGAGVALPEARTSVDWTALDRLVETQRARPKDSKALPELVLWTPEQLLARFGRPTEVWTNDGGVFWNWLATPADLGGKTLDLTLKLVDGRVTNMWYGGE